MTAFIILIPSRNGLCKIMKAYPLLFLWNFHWTAPLTEYLIKKNFIIQFRIFIGECKNCCISKCSILIINKNWRFLLHLVHLNLRRLLITCINRTDKYGLQQNYFQFTLNMHVYCRLFRILPTVNIIKMSNMNSKRKKIS